jgi:mannose-1-phosphate guanylyltransferase
VIPVVATQGGSELVHHRTSHAQMKALILVGGPRKGTRFRPLSLDLPKPLFPIAGKAMIYHHIEACAQVPGLTEIILLGFYEASAFATFMEETSKELKVQIRYVSSSIL